MKKLLITMMVMLSGLLGLQAAGGAEEISLGDLKTAIEAKTATVLDVNGASSYKSGHIPTALHYSAVQKDLAANLPKEKDALIVAYCGGPYCGAHGQATKAALALGYTNVKYFKGGISGWKKAGEPTEKK